MSINPAGTNNYGWNYSKPDKPGYSTQLVGTVLAIQEVQKLGYTTTGQPGAPEFWPDGNPKMNIRLALATPEGELKTFVFQPAGKQARQGLKKSVHMDLFALAGGVDMMNLVGKTICIQTQEGYYGQGRPRPWFVSMLDGGPYQLNMQLPAEFNAPQVLANSAAQGGQVTPPQPAYQQQPQYAQPVYPQPQQYQPQPQPVMYQQPQMQPAYPQVQQQPTYQQPQQQYPNGMDPSIASAMASQAFGGPVTLEYVQPKPADPVGGGEVYEDEMTF